MQIYRSDFVDNRRRYYNILRKMNLQEEDIINQALKNKGFYSDSDVYPLSSLHFELTSKCNAFCRHCYNNSSSHNNIDNMSPDRWLKFSKYLVKNGGIFECLLSGGEPLLLGDKLFEIMDILHADGTIFLVMTNGYLLTNEDAKRFAKYNYHWFQISIDGIDSMYHDWFRQLRGSWNKAIESASSIANNGIPLKIAHCVTPYNLKNIDTMCDLAYSIGASSIMIGGLSLSGRTKNNLDLLLSQSDIKIMKMKVEENRIRYQGKMKVKSANSVKQGLINHSKRPRSGAVIRPNGDIRIDGMAPFVIGNIINDDFTTIWQNKIDKCWSDSRVQDFINNFNDDDRNRQFINYTKKDIYL